MILELLLLAPIDWLSVKQLQKEENTKNDYNPDKEDNKKQSQFWLHLHLPECPYFWVHLHFCDPVYFLSDAVFLDIVFIFRPFLPHSAPSWILSPAENLANSILQDGATKVHYS